MIRTRFLRDRLYNRKRVMSAYPFRKVRNNNIHYELQIDGRTEGNFDNKEDLINNIVSNYNFLKDAVRNHNSIVGVMAYDGRKEVACWDAFTGELIDTFVDDDNYLIDFGYREDRPETFFNVKVI